MSWQNFQNCFQKQSCTGIWELLKKRHKLEKLFFLGYVLLASTAGDNDLMGV